MRHASWFFFALSHAFIKASDTQEILGPVEKELDRVFDHIIQICNSYTEKQDSSGVMRP